MGSVSSSEAPVAGSGSDRPGSAPTALWSWAVSVPLAAALLYLSLRGVEWGHVWSVLSSARLGLVAAACLIGSFTYFLRALRWRILLNAGGRLGISGVFWANMAGYLGNNFLPARAGELVRSALISYRSSLTKTYVLATALTERLMDVIALVIISSLVLIGMEQKPAWLAGASRSTAIIGFTAAAVLLVLPRTEKLWKRLLDSLRLPPRLCARLVAMSEQAVRGVATLHHPARFLGFSCLTVLIWFTDAAGAIVLARALGLAMPLSAALLLLAGMGLGSALPSVPGYIGIYQFAAITVLVPFGFTRSDALAYILLVQAGGYLVITFWGLIGVWKFRSAGAKRLS